jgi:hypothetical protein
MQGRILKDWVQKMADDDIARIMGAVQTGMVAGQSPSAIARTIIGTAAMDGADGITEMSRREVQAVVRTAVNHVGAAARAALYQENSDLFEEEVFVATLDTRTTAVCRAHDGKHYPLGKGPLPPLHYGCFPGDVTVAPIGGVAALSKRHYEGEIVVVRTASGHIFSCTPNHPVLTDRGWLAAELLDESCRVVRHFGGQEPFTGVEVEPQHGPACFEQVFRSFREAFAEHRVQGSAADFHGDGSNGEIHVVWANSTLSTFKRDSTFTHESFEEWLQRGARISAVGSFSALRKKTPLLPGLGPTGGSCVSGVFLRKAEKIPTALILAPRWSHSSNDS